MSVKVDGNSFKKEVLESDVPVLVDFWASWCGPCQMMGPVVEEISTERAGKLKVCKVNVDENPELASEYGVMSIPNFKLFKNGAVLGEQIGAVGKAALLSLVDKA